MAWNIDTAHSNVEFSVRHMMISKVRGTFEKFEGTVELDEANPANTSVDIRILAESVNTRMGQRDDHLRSPDFFNAAEFPYLAFKSTSVEVPGKQQARLTGDLTIRDVTKPVVLDVVYTGQAKSPWGTTSYGFNGTTSINRKDWGLTWNQGLETGGVLVGEEIEINIELELVKVAEQLPA
jgi:polyisoprenoid-binding protein YceI